MKNKKRRKEPYRVVRFFGLPVTAHGQNGKKTETEVRLKKFENVTSM